MSVSATFLARSPLSGLVTKGQHASGNASGILLIKLVREPGLISCGNEEGNTTLREPMTASVDASPAARPAP